jgi:hypothetical protein
MGEFDRLAIERIRANRPAFKEIVAASYPVTSFGDPERARVLTVGINPSIDEFHSRKQGRPVLEPGKKRFVDAETLDLKPGTPLTEEAAKIVLEGNKKYFSGASANPYSWFKSLALYTLEPIGASYHQGTAAHVDLVQWATDPVWSLIYDGDVGKSLIKSDIEFLRELFTLKTWDLIIINGSLAIDTLVEFGILEVETSEIRKVHEKSRTFVTGKINESKAIGFSVNLPNPWTSAITRYYIADWVKHERGQHFS